MIWYTTTRPESTSHSFNNNPILSQAEQETGSDEKRKPSNVKHQTNIYHSDAVQKYDVRRTVPGTTGRPVGVKS